LRRRATVGPIQGVAEGRSVGVVGVERTPADDCGNVTGRPSLGVQVYRDEQLAGEVREGRYVIGNVVASKVAEFEEPGTNEFLADVLKLVRKGKE
jgi:hypothetical protein